MKKFGIGFAAVVLAVAAMSFSNASAPKFACSDTDLIWFEVKVGQGTNNLSIGQKIDLSRINLTQFNDLPAVLPDNTVTNADFPTSGADQRIYSQAGAQTTYSCNSVTYLCRVAFNKTGTPTTDFQISGGKLVIKDDGTGKSNQPVACIIYRTTL